MFINFEKWHGCRNDFIVIWSTPNECSFLLDSLKRQAPRLCAKDGSGIGADGILVLQTLSPRDYAPSTLTIINADGSEAANCGNGLRVAALSVYRHLSEKATHQLSPSLTLSVQGEEKHCHYLPLHSKKNALPWVAVAMGNCRLNQENSWHQDLAAALGELAQKLKLPALNRNFFSAEIGNRHVVVFLDQITTSLLHDIAIPLQQLWGGEGINVHLVTSHEATEEEQQRARLGNCSPVSEVHRALVWERGVGPTAACGSGACAIAVAALSNELAERSQWMEVAMPGGSLYVQQQGSEYEALLAGPGEFVFSGSVEV
jgi:diaminopimelate epimerase